MILSLLLALTLLFPARVYGDQGQLQYYRQLFDQYGRRYGVAPKLLEAIGQTETGLDPNMTGAAGEYGMMQILPSTARAMGLHKRDAYKPDISISYAARFLSQNLAIIDERMPNLTDKRRTTLLIASYNSGVGGALSGHYRQQYVDRVTGYWLSLGGDYSNPTYLKRISTPLAEMTLNEIVVFDVDSDSGRFLDLKFLVSVDRTVTGAELFVFPGCQSAATGSTKAITVQGTKSESSRYSFQVRVPVDSDFRDCWVDVRLRLNTTDGVVSWPWFGIMDPDGYPVERFPF